MLLNGAEILMKVLLEHGVNTVFGYPGGNVLAIYDALAREKNNIRHILTASEAGAAHAADGYARATGHIGVAFATSGPGATNLVTGIATAYMDSSPVLFITGNLPRYMIGTDSFQEVDITGITLPITKYNVMVQDITQLADQIRLAFRVAVEGRPGPVLVDIPRDIQQSRTEFFPGKTFETKKYPLSMSACKKAAELINLAKKPLLLVGGGAKESCSELAALANKLDCPVLSTMMGLGVVPASYTNYLGMPGKYGSEKAASALADCDLVIAVGVRFSDRIVKPGSDPFKVLQIDIDSSEINKNITVEYSILGYASDVITALLPLVNSREIHLSSEKTDVLENTEFSPENIIHAARSTFPDSLVTTDVGQHQIWAAKYIGFERPREFISSGGMGTMGFGLGAAIGSTVGTNRRVLHITGDGSFLMNAQELTTAVRMNLPILSIVMKNGVLGMVRRQQRSLMHGRYSQTTLSSQPDFAMLARAYGAEGFTVRNMDELSDALKVAKKKESPVVIECVIPKDTV